MIDDRYITLAHGNGGRFMRELIEELFARHLANPHLDVNLDATVLEWQTGSKLVTSVDGFTVQPLEFPGGDIGSLAVNGTANDLAVAGAIPRYLSLAVIIEEGLEVTQLERIIASFARAAQIAGVQTVTGDTKVVPRGHGGGLYLITTGIGEMPDHLNLGINRIEDGDAILVSGSVGDHGICVMLAREEFDLKGDVQSDCACVLPLTTVLADLPGLRFMRDPTRGGLATVAYEMASASGLAARLIEDQVPVRDPVRSVCEMLGYDPYYLACEGRVVAVVSQQDAEQALSRWRALPQGSGAQIIGRFESGSSRVILQTSLGGERILDELEDDPLPRIC